MTIPLAKKLKKGIHRTIALAQDLLILTIYDNFPNAVIHGGMAIWRCYGSNRFSEDVDVYLPLKIKKVDFKDFMKDLKNKGLTIEKFRQTGNSVFSKLSFSNTIIRFEAVFRDVKNFTTRNYEMLDGTYLLVNTLNPKDIIEEKILAYIKRRKVRDLYDIFFLRRLIEKTEVDSRVLKLIEKFERPLDEKELKVLIIFGAVPTTEEMLEEVKRWAE